MKYELTAGLGPYVCPVSKNNMALHPIAPDYYCRSCGANHGDSCKAGKNFIKDVMTLPPKEFVDKHSYHWLHAERSSYPVMAEWLNGHWHGSSGTISPVEMRARGWEYYAPAFPPEKGAVPYEVDPDFLDPKTQKLDELLEGVTTENVHSEIGGFTHEQMYAFELLKAWHDNPNTENSSNLFNIATKLFGNPAKYEDIYYHGD